MTEFHDQANRLHGSCRSSRWFASWLAEAEKAEPEGTERHGARHCRLVGGASPICA